MKIVTVVTSMDYTPEEKSILESLGELRNISVEKLKGQDLIDHIGEADIAIVGSSGVEYMGSEVIKACPNLKFISVLGVGTDFIDVRAANKNGIKVSNLQGANSQSVAEHTWGMILSLSKRINESHIGAKEGKYSFLDYLGVELEGKTLGIIGFGQIGSRVAKISKGLNMKVLAFNRSKKKSEQTDFVSLDKLLSQSDVIVLSLPITNETKGIIGKKQFEMMKQNVILVNPARPDLVDENQLFEYLDNGKLFGYGLELNINTPPNEKYYNYPNVLVTPHNGMYTEAAEARCGAMGIDNVVRFVEGNPQNLVN